jgi:hypothetical protein
MHTDMAWGRVAYGTSAPIEHPKPALGTLL